MIQPEPAAPFVVDAKGENPEQYPDWDEDEEYEEKEEDHDEQ